MKIFKVDQGEFEWLELRLGIPTASEFNKIFSPVKLERSKQQKDYIYHLVAERMLERPLEDYSSIWMDRGKEEEKSAIQAYEFMRKKKVDKIGLIKNDNETVGCSPDGLVDEDGGIEIKTPTAKNYIKLVSESNFSKYKTQMQCCMWLSDRQWWDLIIHNEAFGPHIERFDRDNDFIGIMESYVMDFVKEVDQAEIAIRSQLNFPKIERE